MLLLSLTSLAFGADALDTVPELVNGRLRADVHLDAVTSCDQKASTVPVFQGDAPVVAWHGGAGKVQVDGKDVATAPADGDVPLPTDLTVGTHRVCVTGASVGAADVEVTPAVYTQVTVEELHPNGTIRTHGIAIEPNAGTSPVTSARFMESDFAHLDTFADGDGHTLTANVAHDVRGQHYQYDVPYASPVPPGGVAILETRGTEEPFTLAEAAPGELRFAFTHSPNARTPTRRVEVYRLPAGAKLVDAGGLTVRERDGATELVHAATIPVGGTITTAFRFRVDGAGIGLPGPHVVATVPARGATDVDPSLKELRVTFDADMRDKMWAWVQVDPAKYPQGRGKGTPSYADARTCVLPVKLEPDHDYVVWLNLPPYLGFYDADGRPAHAYELTFHTAAVAKK